ncbi:MAG: MBL fold metallo-hydrolase [Polyangiales bacterium]
MFRCTFWGVRGSIPSPGPHTAGVGGNTSCVEVRVGDVLVIFDGGTGLRLLGDKLLKELPVTAHVFFSHVHWDHIQGFPFFVPAFLRGNTFYLYGAKSVTATLEETLAGQMNYPNFPVRLSEMGSKMHFRDLHEREEVLLGALGDVKIFGVPGNHPNGVFAYRIEYNGRSLVYATDTEHYAVPDPNILSVARGADVFIYDSQYTPEEYSGEGGRMPKVGWGHSTMIEGANLAKLAGVKRYVLFHHDPNQNDDDVADKERRAREIFPGSIAAREGLVIDLEAM